MRVTKRLTMPAFILFHHTALLALVQVGYLFPCHSSSGPAVPSIISALKIYRYIGVGIFPRLAVRSNLGSNAGDSRWRCDALELTRQIARASKTFTAAAERRQLPPFPTDRRSCSRGHPLGNGNYVRLSPALTSLSPIRTSLKHM